MGSRSAARIPYAKNANGNQNSRNTDAREIGGGDLISPTSIPVSTAIEDRLKTKSHGITAENFVALLGLVLCALAGDRLAAAGPIQPMLVADFNTSDPASVAR